MNGELVMGEKRKKTGGRKPGSRNRSTLIGKNVSETFRNWLGFDDEAVARTGMIDREGYRARTRLREMIDGERTPDPAWTNLLKVVMGYAFGLPGKMQPEGTKRESLVFLTTNGMLPWDPRADSMREITDAMIAGKEQEEKLKAIEAKAEPVAADKADHDSETPESLELVQEPPESFSGGRR